MLLRNSGAQLKTALGHEEACADGSVVAAVADSAAGKGECRGRGDPRQTLRVRMAALVRELWANHIEHDRSRGNNRPGGSA
jgi:hypothetical protein